MKSGMRDDAHCAMGVVSRDGWALVDDSATARFDSGGAAVSASLGLNSGSTSIETAMLPLMSNMQVHA